MVGSDRNYSWYVACRAIYMVMTDLIAGLYNNTGFDHTYINVDKQRRCTYKFREITLINRSQN